LARGLQTHLTISSIPRSFLWGVWLFLLALASGLFVQPAAGLVKFDFEQKYFVHPQRQVWDFCVIEHDDVFHIFYHTILESAPGAANADTIWHATSPDLYHWSILGPVLTVGPDWWDGQAIWAPDVVWDPDQNSWFMAYTGVDDLMVQRTCFAQSPDLGVWTKSLSNPVFEPDSLVYFWSPTENWSAFRDPFLFEMDGQWNMLSTSGLRLGGYPGFKRGIVHRSTSDDLIHWSDAGVFFEHNGEIRWHDLESSQYLQRGDWYHLFFTEQDPAYTDHPTSHIASLTLGNWDMADREVIDLGWAAEIDSFDSGVDIFSRLAKGQDPGTGNWFHVVRFDTLLFTDNGANLTIPMPHPLARNWASWTGGATLANPTFGDNSALRGDEPCGLVGNGWFGSKEYYQGPLSGNGSPGSALGDVALGTLTSHPFIITGDYFRLLVGGGYYPETCYVALMDADADSVLLRETGHGSETMTERIWDVRPYRGMLAVITIVDAEQGSWGHINVDEIEEYIDPLSDAGDDELGEEPTSVTSLQDLGPRPNPANPATQIRFLLAEAGRVQVNIYDLRGRVIWRSLAVDVQAGQHYVSWNGKGLDGQLVATGVYLYRIQLNNRIASRGKISFVK